MTTYYVKKPCGHGYTCTKAHPTLDMLQLDGSVKKGPQLGPEPHEHPCVEEYCPGYVYVEAKEVAALIEAARDAISEWRADHDALEQNAGLPTDPDYGVDPTRPLATALAAIEEER